MFSETYLSALPEHINIAQRVKLIGIDISPLEKLEEQYNRHIPLSENTDFGVYATNSRQVEKYEACERLKAAYEDFLRINDNYINSRYSMHVSDATRDALIFRGGKLEVNVRGYVLNDDI